MAAPTDGMTLLIAGATGMVGTAVLAAALADKRVAQVIAPTRRALGPHPRLNNPLVDFNDLSPSASWWRADAVICTLGTTMKLAGNKAAFRRVDFDFVQRVAECARAHGAQTFVLNSSLGADAGKKNFYLRTKGEIEQAVQNLQYPSLALIRPSLIDGGPRPDARPGEAAGLLFGRLFRPLIPRRYRPVPVERVARALLEAALTAAPGVTVIESEML